MKDSLRFWAGKRDGESQVRSTPYAERQVELESKEKFLEKQVADNHQDLSRASIKQPGGRR